MDSKLGIRKRDFIVALRILLTVLKIKLESNIRTDVAKKQQYNVAFRSNLIQCPINIIIIFHFFYPHTKRLVFYDLANITIFK